MPARKASPKPQLRNVAAILNRETSHDNELAKFVKISTIVLPSNQPRKYFDTAKLDRLVSSIKEHGILEPLLVRPLPDGKYELVAGERRLRAAKAAELFEVPVLVKELDDTEAQHVALIENLQREDLSPIEETDAILSLLELSLATTRDEVTSLFYQAHRAKHRGQELGQNVLSQLDLVQKLLDEIGRFTIDSFRVSRLPLLKLPSDILEAIRIGQIEYTKGLAIAKLKDDEMRSLLLNEAIEFNLSINKIRLRIKEILKGTSQITLQDRMQNIYKEYTKKKLWDDEKKNKKIEKLLEQLEVLMEDSKTILKVK